MSTGIRRISFMLLLFALVSCAPPVGALRDSFGGGANFLWQVPRRTMYDTTPANSRFIPADDLLVFLSYNGAVNAVPVALVEVQLCGNPNVADLVFTPVPNPPPGAANGYHRFQRNGRYLVRVLYNGMESDPYSIQVGPPENGGDGDGGIITVWRALVTFNSNGGTAVPKQRVDEGATAVEPSPPPAKAGYTFGGWYTEPELTNAYDFNTPVSFPAGVTLYAKWI